MTDEVKVEQVLAMLADRADYERVEIPADKRDMLFADAHAIITQLLAARPAPAEDAVEAIRRAILVGMWGEALADLYERGSDVRLQDADRAARHVAALAAMQPRGEQQAGREEGR